MTQTWLVTGSSVGLGRAIVEAALAAGHNVIATARKPNALAQLSLGHEGQMLALPLDVTSEDDWASALEAGLAKFGSVDVLVNNAGFGGLGSVEEMTLDLIRAQFETNFMGAVHACQTVIPIMRQQGQGRILLISSIGARIATAGAAAYYASKAAVSSFAQSLALEVAPFGIQVTAVEPGGMRTRFAEAESLQLDPFDPSYDATVGATAAMMRSPEYTASLSDPAGHAAMILKLAAETTMPVRLLAGADALSYGTAAGMALQTSDNQWEALSLSATHGTTNLTK